MPRWVTAANQKAKPAVVERLAKMIRGTSAEGFCGWGGAISTLNVTDRLKSISLPTNVIVGAEDPGTPPAAAEAIHREIKGSNVDRGAGRVAHAVRRGARPVQQACAGFPRYAGRRKELNEVTP